MPLVDRDDEIQAFAADGPDDELAKGICRTGVLRARTPKSLSAEWTDLEKIASRSWITNRYGWSYARNSRNCCVVHSAVV